MIRIGGSTMSDLLKQAQSNSAKATKGKEDYAKSRRVELELNVKSSNLQDFMGIVKK